jgi:hypothetical protein
MTRYKRTLVFMQRVRYFCPDLTKIGSFLQILVKVLNMKLYEKSGPGGVSFCAQGWTEGHGQPNSHACKSLVKRKSESADWTDSSGSR